MPRLSRMAKRRAGRAWVTSKRGVIVSVSNLDPAMYRVDCEIQDSNNGMQEICTDDYYLYIPCPRSQRRASRQQITAPMAALMPPILIFQYPATSILTPSTD